MGGKIQGADRLRRKLKAIPEAARASLISAMEAGADDVVRLARGLVPVDDGDLRDSIGWTWGDPPKGAIVITRARPRKNDSDIRLTVYAGNDKAFYARWLEFGTAPHKIKAKNYPALGRDGRFGPEVDHPGKAAQPFFFPAWRAERKRMRAKLRRAITKAAKKVAAGS